MKRFFEFLGIIVIVLFSFYYTEEVALIVQSKNSLLQEIKNSTVEQAIIPVNAIIQDDTIIPGINGQEVNVKDSYAKMKPFGVFNYYYLMFTPTRPQISLSDNKDKIIVGGNKNKRAVSLIIDNNEVVEKYLQSLNIKTTLLVDLDTYKDKTEEVINGEDDKIKFNDLESILNSKGKNKHICLINDLNKEICLKNGNYLVKETLSLNSSNLVSIKSKVESGSIILIKDNAKIEDINLLIKQVKYQDLNIIPLSELISEG